MSETTKRDLARIEFLEAAVAYRRVIDRDSTSSEIHNLIIKELRAWEAYRDLLDGKEENAPLDEQRWFCPHCGTKQPAFNWQLVGQVAIGVGALQYFNVICSVETCRRLITVCMVGYIPDKDMVAQAQAQMRDKFGRA